MLTMGYFIQKCWSAAIFFKKFYNLCSGYLGFCKSYKLWTHICQNCCPPILYMSMCRSPEESVLVCFKYRINTYLRSPITKPENFLKSSSELNLVLSIMTRSHVFLWAGPCCITASSTRHTDVFIRPKDVITSSCSSSMLLSHVITSCY